MKKILFATIITKKDNTVQKDIVSVAIDCSTSDEKSIKHAIESQKNDPSILLILMTRNIPREILIHHKPKLDTLKTVIENCESITADFINLDEIEAILEALTKNHVVYDFSLN